jgi:hypothetical protein
MKLVIESVNERRSRGLDEQLIELRGIALRSGVTTGTDRHRGKQIILELRAGGRSAMTCEALQLLCEMNFVGKGGAVCRDGPKADERRTNR